MAELTLEVVSALPLQSLEEDWVKECWDNHFLDVTPLPLVTENLLQEEGYFVGQLEKLHEVARQWQHTQSDTGGLWTCLLENNVSHKALVALLAHLMPMEYSIRTCHGRKKEAAFIAATVYLSLVGLQGSRAFKVYSPDLLMRAVSLLKASASSGQSGKKRSAQAVTSSQPANSQSRKRGRNATQINSSQNFEIEDDESGGDDGDEDSDPRRVQRFHSLYLNLLSELVELLSSFSLRESSNTVDQVIKALTILTRVDNHFFDGDFPLRKQARRSIQTRGITALAFKGIQHLCQPIHGDLKTLTTMVCKHMLPVMLMLMEGNKVCTAQVLPQNLQLGRQHAVAFVRFLLKEIGEACLPGVKTLLQHVCMRVPDKADYRTRAAQSVVTLLEDFPDPVYAFMLMWIGILSRNEKSSVRAFSLDILTLLLSQSDRHLQGVTEEEQSWASHPALISQLLARCSDVAAVVRTRAITGFAQCLESGGLTLQSTLRDIMTPRTTSLHPPRLDPTPDEAIRTIRRADQTVREEVVVVDKAAALNEQGKSQGDSTMSAPQDTDKPHTPFRTVELTEGLNNSLPDRQGVISMLHRRAREQKVFVRKAALHTLQRLIQFEATSDVRKEDLEVLCERCRDKAVSVRKQSLTSLTEVLMQCHSNPAVRSAWLKGVFAMVWDQETSVQEKCLETVESILLCHIVPQHRSKGEDHTLAWQLLTLISKPEHSDLRRHFKKMCRLWERQKKLKGSLITSILSHIDTDSNEAAWSVLADIATTKISVDIDPVIQYWHSHSHTITGSTEGGTWENVLRIISFKAESVALSQRSRLIGEFQNYLLRFDLKPVLVSALATAIHQLSHVGEGGVRAGEKWGKKVLDACDHALSTVVLDQETSEEASYNEEKLTCQLYTLGVVALLCPSVTPKRAALIVQSFIASPCLSARGENCQSLSAASQPLQSSHGSQVIEEGLQGTERSGSSQVSQCTQGSQFTQGSQSTQPLSQFRGCKMSDRVRAVAFISLGKLCLQDKLLAKKCVPAMARELELSTSDAVRNNIIIIFRDLCVRYTTLVDPYVSCMTACLRDPAPIVRRQTLELLTGLLQEDFLKWKGSLFFRFALTLLDPHPDIAAFGEFCLGVHLLKRYPALMSQHLLESIFVFNNYTKHNVFNKYSETNRERELFSLKGTQNQSHRFKLYQFMLEHMEDEHRFQLTSKITQEVLGAVVDGVLPFDQDSCDLLQDALHILSSKEIKLSSLRSTKSLEDAADDMEMAQAVMATARKTLITQVVKKNVMENVIPTVLALKHTLDKERSPLQKDLMAFLRELMKDYKNEIQDILAGDPQLACEVEYDLRMFETQQNTAPLAQHTVQSPGTQGDAPQSKKPGTPASRPSTPVSAQKRTPSIHTPVRDGAPCASPRGERGGTPQPLPTRNSATRQALLRTVEQLKQRRLSSGRQDGRCLASIKWAQDVIASISDCTSEAEQESEEKEKSQTPQQPRRPLRAISTPSGLLSNLTFAEENNQTMPLVPPSPIPGSSKSHVAVDDTGEDENEEVNIFVKIPEIQGQEKPREWKLRVKTEEQVKEACQPAIVNSPVMSRNRRSCHRQKLS